MPSKKFQSLISRRCLVTCFMTSALFAALPASAQSNQPVRLIVGYAAGGPSDTTARLFAQAFSKELGVPVIVENRGGAGGVVAGDAVAKAEPNGLTLFFAGSPTITISPHILKSMSFDPATALTPIAPMFSYSNVLVVGKEQPFKTVKELVAYAKANPGKVTYASSGVGSSNHLSGELFATRTGTELNHIPYKGNAPAMSDVLGGRVSMMFDVVASGRSFISTGKVSALAVTSHQRNASLPDVPTMIEAGVPDYDVSGWYGLYGPSKLPANLVVRYNDAVRKALSQKDVQSKLVEQGYDLWIGTPQNLADRGSKDRAMWASVTKGIQID